MVADNTVEATLEMMAKTILELQSQVVANEKSIDRLMRMFEDTLHVIMKAAKERQVV